MEVAQLPPLNFTPFLTYCNQLQFKSMKLNYPSECRSRWERLHLSSLASFTQSSALAARFSSKLPGKKILTRQGNLPTSYSDMKFLTREFWLLRYRIKVYISLIWLNNFFIVLISVQSPSCVCILCLICIYLCKHVLYAGDNAGY